jgi:predicted Zn-dependent peptidase
MNEFKEEEIKERKRQVQQEWRSNNQDKVDAYNRKYQQARKERIHAMRNPIAFMEYQQAKQQSSDE